MNITFFIINYTFGILLAPSSEQDSKFYTNRKTQTSNLNIYILSWEHWYRSSDWRGVPHKMSPVVGSG